MGFLPRCVWFQMLVVVLWAAAVRAQLAEDVSLFTVTLNEDSSSLLYCKRGAEIRRQLSGPVIMADASLLLFSENGYILYEQAGVVIDSHSVMRENAGNAPGDPRSLRFAYPIDTTTILYYREVEEKGRRHVALFQKKLFKKRLKSIKEEQYGAYPPVARGQLFNLAHNTITDEMASKVYLKPQCVGFTALEGGERWWSVDRFYSFSSAVINEKEGQYRSFFPGIKASGETGKAVRRQMVDAFGTFERDGRKYYVGTYATLGTSNNTYYQTIYICDDAGNILHSDEVLKQTIVDVVLGTDEKEKMMYTARQKAQYVFQPSVDDVGHVYYGILDYEEKSIEVHRMRYAVYHRRPAQPDLAHSIDAEKGLSFEPVSIPCNVQQSPGKTIPSVTFIDEGGERRTARVQDLTRDDFLVRITRQVYRDVEKKVSQARSPIPRHIHAMRDSLSRLSTLGCPFAVSLSGPTGMLCTFDYSPGEIVVCARVIRARTRGDVIVRVDLEEYAEILVFGHEGDYINRFTFNRQHYTNRRDIVVASSTGDILELDFEFGVNGGTFFTWVPDIASSPRGGK